MVIMNIIEHLLCSKLCLVSLISDLIRSHCCNYHLYTNDSQLYISSPDLSPKSWIYIPNSLFNISLWMSNWHLKLDMFKTELILSNLLHLQPSPSQLMATSSLLLFITKSLETFFFNRKEKITHVLIIQLQQLSTNAQSF